MEPKLETKDLSFLMQHDTDAYNRWDASQTLLMRALLESSSTASTTSTATPALLSVAAGMKTVLSDAIANKEYHLAAVLLSVPTAGELCQAMELPVSDRTFPLYMNLAYDMYCLLSLQVDPVAAAEARRHMKQFIANNVQEELISCFEATKVTDAAGVFSIEPEEQGRRALHNLCLDYLVLTEKGGVSLSLSEYEAATCMTEKMGALLTLTPFKCEETNSALTDFERAAEGALVV